MKSVFRSFYGKLSLVFLILLIILGVVQIYITIQSSLSFVRAADQSLNAELAENMAREFTPHVKDSIDFKNIEHQIHYMMVINPHIEIYLISGSGKILAFFAEPKKKVKQEYINLEPVRRFVNAREQLPILGDDPRHPGRKKTFSAAPLNIGKDQSGFVYIILGGEQYDTATGLIRESFIAQTTVKGLVLALVFAGLLGLLLFAFLTKRLHKVTRAVKSFERGDFSERISVKSEDELGQLGHAFNNMADTIERNMEELKRTDLLRRELIANVSHDLRSPLASIQGYLETILMKKDSLDEQRIHDYLETIFNNTIMLNRLVNELFELSKLDARQIEPNLEPFSMAELIQDVVMKFKQQAEKKNIHLEAILPQNLPFVKADIAMIERVISNLLDNAIRFTPESGQVRVEPLQVNKKIRVTVSDNGYGIPPEDLPNIFDRFYRVRKGNQTPKAGTGLGLAIARKILELHNSIISVESKPEAGTTFKFDLQLWEKDGNSERRV